MCAYLFLDVSVSDWGTNPDNKIHRRHESFLVGRKASTKTFKYVINQVCDLIGGTRKSYGDDKFRGRICSEQ